MIEHPTVRTAENCSDDLDISDTVVLLDELRRPIGQASRLSVHTHDTPLHLAFSVYLFNGNRELLLTRRALGKATWPGVWTNSCCGHPRAEETLEHGARRRVDEELGVSVLDLQCVLPDFTYRATDASGVVENEFCPVFTATLHPDATLSTNSEEVMDWRWVPWSAVSVAVERTPFIFSPWAVEQIHQMTTSEGMRSRHHVDAEPYAFNP